jgi:hypothetical protein
MRTKRAGLVVPHLVFHVVGCRACEVMNIRRQPQCDVVIVCPLHSCRNANSSEVLVSSFHRSDVN